MHCYWKVVTRADKYECGMKAALQGLISKHALEPYQVDKVSRLDGFAAISGRHGMTR